MKRAIVTGASAGIGWSLCLRLADAGYLVGAMARRADRLAELAALRPGKIIAHACDMLHHDHLVDNLNALAAKLGGMDLMIANAGVGRRNPELLIEPELETIGVNVTAFVICLDWAAARFRAQGRGHLVGISSVAAFWGNGRNPAYNASKAFDLRYLQGLNSNLRPQGIIVTDIRPGFIATEMTAGRDDMFWVAKPEKAADQIYRAIKSRKRVAYITRRWRFMAWMMRLMPYHLYRYWTVQD